MYFEYNIENEDEDFHSPLISPNEKFLIYSFDGKALNIHDLTTKLIFKIFNYPILETIFSEDTKHMYSRDGYSNLLYFRVN